MFNKLKRIKPGPLITHVIITLAYPVARAVMAEKGTRLLRFTDAMTIGGLILVIFGVIYGMSLRGYYDLTGYFFLRGIRSFRFSSSSQVSELNRNELTVDEYLRKQREKREDAFNYPMFLGIAYLILSGVLAYTVLS